MNMSELVIVYIILFIAIITMDISLYRYLCNKTDTFVLADKSLLLPTGMVVTVLVLLLTATPVNMDERLNFCYSIAVVEFVIHALWQIHKYQNIVIGIFSSLLKNTSILMIAAVILLLSKLF